MIEETPQPLIVAIETSSLHQPSGRGRDRDHNPEVADGGRRNDDGGNNPTLQASPHSPKETQRAFS
jgi:hypothetical protein